MVEASTAPRILRFGPYEADLSTGELRRDGVKISVQDKPFQILELLVQRPGELVTREDLRARLWPADTFVDFEHGLNTAVKKLRQALDDSAEDPRYVETLPKRGYRFLAPVTGAGPADATEPRPAQATAPAPEMDEAAPGPTARRRRPPWRIHAAWLGALLAVLALSPRLGPAVRQRTPPPNRQPVVVLMDSPLEGRVYDPRTAAAGGTNADDITDALRDLPIAVEKETTSPMWHREAQLVQQNPDLIVSHLSCLLDERTAGRQRTLWLQLFNQAVDRLLSLFAYVALQNPRARFLVYSRGRFDEFGGADKFVEDSVARFPPLRGRLHAWNVPGGFPEATFRDPETARLIRERVKAILALP